MRESTRSDRFPSVISPALSSICSLFRPKSKRPIFDFSVGLKGASRPQCPSRHMGVEGHVAVGVDSNHSSCNSSERLAKETCYRLDYFIHVLQKSVARTFEIDELGPGYGFSQDSTVFWRKNDVLTAVQYQGGDRNLR